LALSRSIRMNSSRRSGEIKTNDLPYEIFTRCKDRAGAARGLLLCSTERISLKEIECLRIPERISKWSALRVYRHGTASRRSRVTTAAATAKQTAARAGEVWSAFIPKAAGTRTAPERVHASHTSIFEEYSFSVISVRLTIEYAGLYILVGRGRHIANCIGESWVSQWGRGGGDRDRPTRLVRIA
jgi:hypothetical protein